MNAIREAIKKCRKYLAIAAMIVVLVLLLGWLWQNRVLMIQVLYSLGLLKFVFLVLGISAAYLIGVFTFTLLVQSLGYSFTFPQGYHALNFAQIAGTVPGGIWGIAGLAGWLWGRGINKADSAFVVLLNLLFSLGACALFGLFAIAGTLGWQYGLLALLPVFGWILGRAPLERVRLRFFSAAAPLPSVRAGVELTGLDFLVWVVEAMFFTWLVFDQNASLHISPLFVASAYAAGYLVGYLVLVAPAGLGVREGILIVLLGNAIGVDKVLALSLAFRLAQTTAQWANISVSWLLQFGIRKA